MTPRAVLDEGRLRRNAEAMKARCEALGVQLRPHVKTHKVPELARLQTDGEAVTVSTLAEARAFAAAGFTDITWAMPLPLSRRDEALELGRSVTLNLLVDSIEAADALAGTAARVLLKVDCGYGRAGLRPEDPEALRVARRLAECTDFRGLLTHAGHSYDCRDRADLRRVAEQERRVTVDFAERLRAEGIPVPTVSIGSTPTLAVARELKGVTEVRPGNYVLLDLAQVEIGHCRREDIALTVETTVISAHPERLVVDAGALALSKDRAFGHYGEVQGHGWPVVSLSQEHGVVRAPAGHGLRPGARLRVLPAHSCLVGPLLGGFDLERDATTVAHWVPAVGW